MNVRAKQLGVEMTKGLKQHVKVWPGGGGRGWVLGHFGHRHFALGCFGLDISARDITATDNAKGGRFDHNNKLWVGDYGMHV